MLVWFVYLTCVLSETEYLFVEWKHYSIIDWCENLFAKLIRIKTTFQWSYAGVKGFKEKHIYNYF